MTSETLQAQAPTKTQRWAFLAVISGGLFLIGVDNSILYTALPLLREQLAATETQALWIINAYPFPFFYSLHAPAEVADNFSAGVHHAIDGDAARASLDTAYINVLIIALVCAVAAALISSYLFRGNPKGANNAH